MKFYILLMLFAIAFAEDSLEVESEVLEVSSEEESVPSVDRTLREKFDSEGEEREKAMASFTRFYGRIDKLMSASESWEESLVEVKKEMQHETDLANKLLKVMYPFLEEEVNSVKSRARRGLFGHGGHHNGHHGGHGGHGHGGHGGHGPHGGHGGHRPW